MWGRPGMACPPGAHCKLLPSSQQIRVGTPGSGKGSLPSSCCWQMGSNSQSQPLRQRNWLCQLVPKRKRTKTQGSRNRLATPRLALDIPHHHVPIGLTEPLFLCNFPLVEVLRVPVSVCVCVCVCVCVLCLCVLCVCLYSVSVYVCVHVGWGGRKSTFAMQQREPLCVPLQSSTSSLLPLVFTVGKKS